MNQVREFRTQTAADPRSTAELIRLALAAPDDDAAWKFVAILHSRCDHEVLDAARGLCFSELAPERKLGAHILGQIGAPGAGFPDAVFDCLANLLRRESDEEVLAAIAFALGHLDDPRCLDMLLSLKGHPSAGVRFGVVNGISGQSHPAAVQTLVELSRDEDRETRDWATFGLGTFIDTDSEEIREALAARLGDEVEEIRNEALVGLARRRDPRALPPLLVALSGAEPSAMHIEAAMALGDAALLPSLMAIKHRREDHFSAEAEWLDKAIDSCLKGRERGNEGTREQGNEGTRERGNEGTRERGNEGTRERGNEGTRGQ
jgi:HEAT repeat protein